MGINSLMEKLTGKGGSKNKLVDSVAGMLDDNSSLGGLDGVLNRFRDKGMADKADSWVSDGENKPLTPREVEDALGEDKVERLAKKSGVSHDEAASGIASMLPDFVDKLTPGGRKLDGGALQDTLTQVRKKFS